ncbi:MAG: oligosaccharide flippase family protein [Devosia sp.]|uniref:lipopolysaccharide biosynthesis protein n=1 Tax=Devosia sp. TaxID=1871048 RepID=UPI00263404EC|nr:oligosaccharide flippase family protein [Devosia sp.]MDB5538300.1 oligosaccharide flippase family protein [Devosia sp.]
MSIASPDLRALLRTGLSRSLVSLLIKVATAGLTYLMYVVLSRTMGGTEYGYFAFGLSLATVLAIGASVGQQTAILRYWPEEEVAGRHDKALEALRSGGALTLLAGIALSAVTLTGAAVMDAILHLPSWHLYAAAALILPMAFAEYWSSALRAQGSVWTALTPRDILWRVLTPLAVVALFALGAPLSGWQALLLTALLLALALALQYGLARLRRYEIAPGFGALRPYWRENGTASRWFLFGTVIDAAALNMDTIFIGLLVTAEAAGIYFNAFRTAGLLTLFMFAITLVVAPMVARHYHAGEMKQAQAITALCAWAGFLFSLVVFVGYLVFGDALLALFGAHSAEGYWVLILLSVGLLFDAATGPSRIVMMMTGHERAYVRIWGSIMLIGLVVELAVIPAFGLLGAAAVNALSRGVAQFAIAFWSHRNIGIDTTLWGAFRVRGLADAPRRMVPL